MLEEGLLLDHGIMMREETSYHWGSISRETAEQILLDQGAADGLFLVRDSSATDSVLSLCHNHRSGKNFCRCRRRVPSVRFLVRACERGERMLNPDADDWGSRSKTHTPRVSDCRVWQSRDCSDQFPSAQFLFLLIWSFVSPLIPAIVSDVMLSLTLEQRVVQELQNSDCLILIPLL